MVDWAVLAFRQSFYRSLSQIAAFKLSHSFLVAKSFPSFSSFHRENVIPGSILRLNGICLRAVLPREFDRAARKIKLWAFLIRLSPIVIRIRFSR